MSDTNVAVVPPNPPGYKTYLTSVAGILALGVLPFLHSIWVFVPTLNVDQSTAVLGTILSLAVLFHRYGLNTVGKYVLTNIVPVLMPSVRAALVEVVHNELVALQPQAQAAGIDVAALEKVLDDVVNQEQKAAIVAKLVRPK